MFDMGLPITYFINFSHILSNRHIFFSHLKDIEDRVGKTFPTPIDKWALTEAREIIDKSKKKKSVLPFDRVHSMLQKVISFFNIELFVIYLNQTSLFE